MSIITTVVNPMNDEEVTIATGTVKRLLFKDSSPAQKKYDTNYIGTIIVSGKGGEDDVFVTIGLKKQEDRIAYAEGKKGSEKWFELQEGDEVKLTLKVSGSDPQRPFYSTTATRIKVTKRADKSVVSSEGSKQEKGATKSSYKKDTTGMETGHALNGALYLQRNSVKGDVVDLAKIVHSTTVAMKKAKSEDTGTPVDNYDLGASVGHAVLNACRDFKEKTVTQELLIEAATPILLKSEEIQDFIKGGATETKAPVVKKEPVKEEIPQAFDDFSDDIPF